MKTAGCGVTDLDARELESVGGKREPSMLDWLRSVGVMEMRPEFWQGLVDGWNGTYKG